MKNEPQNNHNVTIAGVTKCLTEWARTSGITRKTIRDRMSRGMTLTEAIVLPTNRKRAETT